MPYFTPEKPPRGKYINLFTEKAFFNRTCDEIKISPFDCSCLVVQEIKHIKTDPEFYKLVLTVIDEALYKMNSVVHTALVGEYKICKKITLNKILNTYGNMLNNKVEELQVKFSVNENPDAIFEVFSFIGSHVASPVLITSKDKGSVITYAYRGYKVKIKLFGITRKDKYAGRCEDVTRKLNIKSEYCLCDKEALDFYK